MLLILKIIKIFKKYYQSIVVVWQHMQSSLLSSGILCCTVQRVTIPDAVLIQFVLLKMGMLILETCREL